MNIHHHTHNVKSQEKSEKTLVILFGEFRGNDASWKNMVSNLITPYNADLALCIGYKDEHHLPPLNPLTEIAKYHWNFKEPKAWCDYLENWFDESTEIPTKWWKENVRYGIYGGGGTDGLIPMIFQHYIYHNYLHVLNQYDRIILTRPDMYFVRPYPILSSEHVWIPNGEDHGGLYDRLIIFPPKYAKECLTVLDFMNTKSLNLILKKMYKVKDRSLCYIHNTIPVRLGHFNSEIYHKIFYEWNKILYKIKRSPLLNFLIAVEGNTTKSPQGIGNTKFKDGLLIRYKNEYIDVVRTQTIFGDCIDDYIE